MEIERRPDRHPLAPLQRYCTCAAAGRCDRSSSSPGRTVQECWGLDYRSMAFFRVLIGIVIIYDCLDRWDDLYAWYTDAGALESSVLGLALILARNAVEEHQSEPLLGSRTPALPLACSAVTSPAGLRVDSHGQRFSDVPTKPAHHTDYVWLPAYGRLLHDARDRRMCRTSACPAPQLSHTLRLPL